MKGLCTPEWLAERCHRDEDGCLIWRGKIDGYNMPVTTTPRDANGKRTNVMVRRDALAVRLGRPIPKSMRVICTCGKDRCVEHLAEVPPAEVIRRQWKRTDHRVKRIASLTKASRKRGKLDMEKALDIRNSTEPLKTFAERYGVSITLASQVRRGLLWKEDRNPWVGLGASNDSQKRAA